MMRCRTGERARPPSGGLPERGSPYMQQPIGNVQPEQWSWILSTLWSWIWAGLSWIVIWQAKVFTLILGGDSFWAVVAGALLLLLPATALAAGVWGTMISLYTLPFRLGRAGTLLQSLLIASGDAVRLV